MQLPLRPPEGARTQQIRHQKPGIDVTRATRCLELQAETLSKIRDFSETGMFVFSQNSETVTF
jgi:hypothetical protein